MPNKMYSWDEMLATYEIQMIASYEKSKGRYVHGEELSALSFWLMLDTEKKGTLDEERIIQLAHGLRYTNVNHFNGFRKEF